MIKAYFLLGILSGIGVAVLTAWSTIAPLLK